MKPLGVCLACLLTLILAAPASAQKQIAPPGNGGVDEYLETVPGAGGNRPVDRNGRPNRGGLTPSARRKLAALGKDGRAAAALAAATAPGRDGRSTAPGGAEGSRDRGSGAGSSRDRGSGTGAAAGAGRPDDKGDSALATALRPLLEGGLLPLVLLAVLAGAIALAVLKRRRAGS